MIRGIDMRVLRHGSMILIAILLTTTMVPIIEGADPGPRFGPPTPPMDYHPGFIHLNVVEENGTPAEGFRVVHSSTGTSSFPWTVYLDSSGDGDIKVRFDTLGKFKLQIYDLGHNKRYLDYYYLNPDQHLYMNITLGPAPVPYKTITGIVTSEHTGQPIAGLQVGFSGMTDYDESVGLTNITDSAGRYSLMVPNNSYSLSYVYSQDTPNTHGVYEYFFMFSDKHHYEIDLFNPIKFNVNVATRARFINTASGQPIKGSFSSSVEVVDRGFAHYSASPTSGPGGWYNFSADKGEGSISIQPDSLPYSNMTMSISTPYIHNGTPMDIEVPVDMDFIVPVQITVQNSTSPLSGVMLNYYLHGTRGFGWYNINYWNGTGSDGSIEAWFPINEVKRVHLSKIGYKSTEVEVDTTGSGPYEYEIELIPMDVLNPPEAVNATITVIDDDTGLPVPAARIYGYNSLGNSYRLDDYTNDTGVWTGQMYTGTFNYLNARSGLGFIQMDDVIVPENQDFELTLRIQREDLQPSPSLSLYHFTFVDTNGSPVPNASIYISSMQVNQFSSWGAYFTTNDEGKVSIRVVDGSEVRVYGNNWINGEINWWAPVREVITLPEGGGSLPPITLYKRNDFSSVTGFIYDSETGSTIPLATIRCRSVEEVSDDEPTRIGPMMKVYDEGAEFIYLTRNSIGNGFYRTWVANTGLFRVEAEGYFPYEAKIETMPVRGDFTHDVFLDPLVEDIAWINGTLVDENGGPIEGFLNITDIDHPAMGGIDIEINSTGEFSIETYPGNFLLRYYNETLEDTMEVELTTDGIENLELILIPHSMISGRVLDKQGDPLVGINVTMLRDTDNGTVLVDWIHTVEGGNFSFMVTEGVYTIYIERTELYGTYQVYPITVNGWNDWYDHLYLLDRTQADISGIVTGSGGPYSDGIPDVSITIMDGTTTVAETVTGLDGRYEMLDVSHGVYNISIQPSGSLLAVENQSSGYVGVILDDVEISGAMVDLNPNLEYLFVSPAGYVNVSYNSPVGTEVYLDEQILIEFTEIMDQDLVEDSIYLTPGVEGLEFTWDEGGYLVYIDHDPFEQNTIYIVTVGAGVRSIDGWPLWEDVFTWNFTTGTETDPWGIIDASIELDGMNLSVIVDAVEGIEIFFCIMNIGYFPMPYSNGSYELYFTEDTFDHETTYEYFFTDVMNGVDKAPSFSGTFTTPADTTPDPKWEIFDATVEVTPVSGDLKIEVNATEGITIYIVIDDVGSFELNEGPLGKFMKVVNFDNFEDGQTYSYHFSDEEGGDDLAPEFSGMFKIPDKSNDIGEEGEGWGSETCCTVCLVGIIIVLLLVIVMIFISKRKKRSKYRFDEE